MAKETFVNPFDMYVRETEVVFIEALNAEVTLQSLTMAENDAFTARLFKNYKNKDEMNIDMAEATKINYEKVSLALVQPKMTVNQLKALSTKATDAIAEIVKHIDGREDDEEAEEGNDN